MITTLPTPRVNPIAQIVGLFILLVPVFLSFDPWTPLTMLVPALLLAVVILKPDLKAWAGLAWPLLSLSGVLLIMNLFFTDNRVTDRLVWAWACFSVTDHSMQRALSVFARSITLTSLSTLTVFGFSPISLVRSLMHQAKLPPLWGFSLYAGLNVLPFVADDLRIMRQTRMIRLAGRRQSWTEVLSFPLFILASAIKRAERISLSMIVRDLEVAGKRTFLVQSFWKAGDTQYLIVCTVLSFLVFWISIVGKFYQFNLG